MDWRRAFEILGFDTSREPSIEALIPAAAIITAALLFGRFAGTPAGLGLAAWLRRRAGVPEGAWSDRAPALARLAATALVLLVGLGAVPLTPLGFLTVAGALAVATGGFTYLALQAAGLAKTVALALSLAVAIVVAAGALGGLRPLVNALDQAAVTIGARRVSALGVLQLALALALLVAAARLANRLVRSAIARTEALDSTQKVLAQKLAGLAVLVAAVLAGVDLLGIDLTALAFFSGAFGLAIGFGLQKTFGNLISGLILLMDRSIKPGDVIVVGDQFGWVSRIGVRAVSVLTRDGKEHLIPNETLMTERVENWSYSDRNVRIRISVGIAYDADIDLAQRLMVESAVACPRALPEPPPVVWLKGFGESSVDHDILVWIEDPEAGVGNVQSDILNRLFRAFREHGVEIPFAQRDIRIKEMPGVEQTRPASAGHNEPSQTVAG